MKFSDVGLKPDIIRALDKMGYVDMTPIQEKTCQPILDGKDILGLAETGSGKTSACAVPLCNKVDTSSNDIQTLILVPTRELALQYVDEVSRVAQGTGVKCFAIYGGFSMDIQQAKMKDGVHILVATPGRLIDLLYNTDFALGSVKSIVLDEADEMLNMGFFDDVNFILSCARGKHQVLLFSATMPKEIEALTKEQLNDPITIKLTSGQKTPQSLKHCFLSIHPDKRLSEIIRYLKTDEVHQAIVFCNSRHSGEATFKELSRALRSVEFIHGGLDQQKRTSVFNRFKKKNIHVMVATDVAGRGLDFEHVSHVINFDFPMTVESYTHRTGRAGRMGRKGLALTYVTNRDKRHIGRLVDQVGIEPQWIGDAPDLNDRSGGGGGGQGRRRGGGGGGRGRGSQGGGKRNGSSRNGNRRGGPKSGGSGGSSDNRRAGGPPPPKPSSGGGDSK